MLTYEQKLDRDISWALLEGSMHFEKESAVHKALQKITKRLEELGIPYALVGSMAMFLHGYRRFTEDVDLLVTRNDLQEIHQRLEGLGYVPPFSGSKQLRDVELGVRIEFLVSGDYPGDGKPKSVVFPNPTEVATEIDGIRVVRLPELVNLKLASGMTSPGRMKDIADVQELILTLELTRAFVDQLNPFVKDKFLELWDGAQFERKNLERS